MLRRKQYSNLNHIHINSHALQHNYQYFQNNNFGLVAPVIKSNAYGHGLLRIAKWIDSNLDVPFICVDSLYEAYELYKAGINTPIFIMGYTDPQNFNVYKNLPFHWPVFDLHTATMLNKHQKGANIHIKIDSGMGRLGLQLKDIEDFIDGLDSLKNLHVVGIYSHLSQADSKSPRYTHKQIDTFKKAIYMFESRGYDFTWKHISATAAATPAIFTSRHSKKTTAQHQSSKTTSDTVISSKVEKSLSKPKINPHHITDKDFNLIRLGLGFYGLSPFGEDPHLKPALSLTTRIAQIKSIEKGSAVSYGGTWKAPKDSTIAILPIGYNDGVDRRLSNAGIVYYGDTACPIIGRVCMNITIIDITKIKKPRVGDTIEIIGTDLSKKNHAYHHAKLCDTIPYEILTNLTESTKRVME